jgi:hypothetical protein
MLRILLAIVLAALLAVPAAAAEWTVTRLRGAVEQLVDEQWAPLKRGDTIPYDRDIRTLDDGHAELQRNLEILTLGPNTAIRIQFDIETGFTTVLQQTGRLEVEVEAKRVKHFAVETPYLAAVVKGTHFVVTTDEDGASVAVDRGSVAVQSISTERSTTIGIGQTATVKRKADLVVGGLGPWPPIVEKGALPIENSALPAPDGMASDANAELVAAGPLAQAGVGSAGALMAGDTAEPADPLPPVSANVILIGLLIGAALGAVALVFRRAVR